VEVIDARTERAEGEAWSAVPAELRARIATELESGGRVAVFAARKGYAPVVICRDCGEALRDERGKVYAFAQEKGIRIFRTSDGRSVRSTDITCPICDSWNLLPLGVGAERVAEELRTAFPEAACSLFDSDTVRTAVGAARKLVHLKEPGSIVVGTEAMAPWLLAASPAPLSLAAIASADSLLALPFWRARERFLRLGFLLADLAPRAVLATRLPEDAAVKTLHDPNDSAFFEEEDSLRTALGYPPHGTLIALSWQGSVPVLDKLEPIIKQAVAGHEVRAVSDRLVRGVIHQRTRVLLLPKDEWPDAELSIALSMLPPSVRVLVDPESFW
jgi:primosomal protein N' (replication factor Y)